MKTIGMCAVSGPAFRRRATSKPSMPGITASSSTMSGTACTALCSAALAVRRDEHGVAGVVERVVQHGQVVGHVVDDQHDVGGAAVRKHAGLGASTALIASSWNSRASARMCATKRCAVRFFALDLVEHAHDAAKVAEVHQLVERAQAQLARATPCCASACTGGAGGRPRRLDPFEIEPAPEPVEQLGDAHRLQDEVAARDADVVVEPLVEGVRRDDRDRRAVGKSLLADRADRLPAVDARHREVHQDRVGPRLARAAPGIPRPTLPARRRSRAAPGG